MLELVDDVYGGDATEDMNLQVLWSKINGEVTGLKYTENR
jgi:hypothetical protein